MADGWEESTDGQKPQDQFWTKQRPEDPVHKVWVAGHKYPDFVRVRFYMKSAEDQEMVRRALDSMESPLKGLVLETPKRNQQDKVKQSLCGFSLDGRISGAALDALPGMGDPATVADHFHDMIQVAMATGTA